MPFPLAHPAAVLPFRRYCPRWFSFPALVVGSLAPDLGYFFGRFALDRFSHQLLGSFLFCLPVGILCLVFLYALRSYAVRKVFKATPPPILQLAWSPLGSPWVVVISLLAGAWTHLFLDSFTHQSGWLAERLPWLQLPLGSVAGRMVRVYSVLWYACSFVGVTFVFLAFRNWQQESLPAPAANLVRANWRGAVLVAAVVLPIELVHRLLNNWVGLLLVSFLTLLVLLLVVRGSGPIHIAARH